MGYLVETAGRVLLPREREAAALEALTVAMNDRQGWFRQDDPDWPITSLADLATFAATSVTRDGDWLVLATDEEGDPKWSEQATAFYAEVAHWVDEGTVLITGEDGDEWSYTYAAGGVTQSENNGWDGSAEPFGEAVGEQPPADGPKRRGWFRRR